MDHGPPASAEYLAGWLQDRLAEDGGLYELGITVRVAGDVVSLTGVVSTEERRDKVGAMAGSLVPDKTIRNEVTVTSNAEPAGRESLS